ncbi:MAG: transketolase-like TK C-terminal-containing protein, partial [Ectothiorhodospira sp.]
IRLVREKLGWSHEPFVVPDEIYAGWDARDKGRQAESDWQARFEAYCAAHPDLAAEFTRRMAGDLPADWEEKATAFIRQTVEKAEKVASRKASQQAIGGYAPVLPEILGGSADLAGSNLTLWPGARGLSREVSDGNYIYYGVREFAMAALMNGIALHGGFIPYGGTFLIFSDYARNGLRMSALMKQRVVYVLTHDSIGLGEDGPTHQPVEQVSSLRLIPNMSLWRPCDAAETAVAWKQAIERRDGPTALILSRQGLPPQTRDEVQMANVARGGYVLRDTDGTPEAILIATGSEVALAMEAAEALAAKGRGVRVVSMPSVDVFEAQDADYRDAVLPPSVRARVAVETGATAGWYKYVGLEGRVVGMDCFGESAPGGALMEYFGFTADHVTRAVEEVLG